jgi:hypothetical protein
VLSTTAIVATKFPRRGPEHSGRNNSELSFDWWNRFRESDEGYKFFEVKEDSLCSLDNVIDSSLLNAYPFFTNILPLNHIYNFIFIIIFSKLLMGRKELGFGEVLRKV